MARGELLDPEAGARLRRLRELLGKARWEVSPGLRMSDAAYARYERGETSLLVSQLPTIAERLGVDLEWLALYLLGLRELGPEGPPGPGRGHDDDGGPPDDDWRLPPGGGTPADIFEHEDAGNDGRETVNYLRLDGWPFPPEDDRASESPLRERELVLA